MKTITGRSFRVSVHTKESVTSLKSRICREQFPELEHVIRLYHCKRIMHGHCSVSDYNVREGDVIHLALPLHANGSINGDDGLDNDDLISELEQSKRQDRKSGGGSEQEGEGESEGESKAEEAQTTREEE